MGLRFRLMEARDIRECAALVQAHPVIGPRYAHEIDKLRAAWLRLVGCEAMKAVVYQDVAGAAIRTYGFGVGVFVSDDFVREMKTAPLCWFGPELARRVEIARSPVLSDAEVRRANSGAGLNVMVWEAFPHPDFCQRHDVYHLMVEAFIELHRGFLLKEMITSQAESVQRLQWSMDAGGLIWDPVKARYMKIDRRDLEEFIRAPHVVGITREMEFARLGSWIGTLFDYQPPRIGFSRSEQRLLDAALAAKCGTDRALTGKLGVSLSTIKKMWLSVYRRVTELQPETVCGCRRTGEVERGQEKRRRVLAYLREHPEELRPVSQKRLGRQPVAPKRIQGVH
jgi:hypothetical protein